MAYPPPPAPPRRPIGVAILAILVILVGIVSVIITLLLVVGALALIPLLGILPVILAGILFLLALLVLLAGFGLWNLRPWAWWLATFVLFVSLALGVGNILAAGGFGAASPGQLISLGLQGLIFIYLLAVRGSFRSSAYPR